MMDRAKPEKSGLLGLAGALVCGTGAFLAGYSVLVKLAAIPCFSASCGSVINSVYGTLAGIPVGIFGLLVWGALPHLPRSGRIAAKAAMVGGSVVFILIQVFVLDQFCPICGAHALACFAVAGLPVPRRQTFIAVYLGLVLSLMAGAWADGWNRHRNRQQMLVPNPAAAVSKEPLPGLAWLSDQPLDDSRIVISLSCGQCQRILEDLLATRSVDRAVAPILFLTEEENDGVTRVVVAAVLSVGDDQAVGACSTAVALLFEDDTIIARDDEMTATFLLSESFPDLESYLGEAEQLLERHAEALDALGVSTTPTVIVNGVPGPYERSAILRESAVDEIDRSD
jgi:uncharacterized membrane protein